ncbi:MAG: HlyD family efflux transporter periplasmic adaptor subunit [Oscillospiraceae bacterium]|nr:HlyD family efflux transporter periplasmic adaptor subunit [Oscillospiraceae bacterium]
MFKRIKRKYDNELETAFLSETLEIVEKPASPLGHFMIWIVTAIILTAIIWSCVGEMDEVAIAAARIVPKDGVQVVQPLNEGTVTKILVEEGQEVKKGQVLILLDSTAEQIGIENSENKINGMKLQNELAQLLLNGTDISSYAAENGITDIEEVQMINLMIEMSSENKLALNQLISQYEQYKKQTEIEKDNLDKLNNELLSFQVQKTEMVQLYDNSAPEEQSLENYALQLEIAEKEYGEYKKLYEIGAVAEYQLEEKKSVLDEILKQIELQEVRAIHESTGNSVELAALEREISMLIKDISAQEKTVQKQEELLNQSEMAIKSAETEFKQKLNNIIVTNNQTITDQSANLKLQEQSTRYQSLVSPVDGTVQTISVTTVGGVVTSAQPIVSIVPKDAELIIEADVLNKDIGYVFAGQEVSVKLDTFSFQKYGTLNGKINYVSPSAVEDEKRGLIYKIKAETERTEFLINGENVSVSSGMSGTAEIKLEKRKVIEFFLEPIFEYFDDSLKVR